MGSSVIYIYNSGDGILTVNLQKSLEILKNQKDCKTYILIILDMDRSQF